MHSFLPERNKICEKIGAEDWSVEKPDLEAFGPYAYNNEEWVGYDDEDMSARKVWHFNKSIHFQNKYFVSHGNDGGNCSYVSGSICFGESIGRCHVLVHR